MGVPAFEDMLRVLRVAPAGPDRFTGPPQGDEENPWNLYGGHLIGQALAAACATAPADRPVHSMHAYFLRPGDPTAPIDYEVVRTRDGKAFSHRRAAAHQHGKAIFELTASFQAYEEGREHQQPMPPGAPDPEAVTGFPELMASHETPPFDTYWTEKPRPMDLRYVNAPWAPAGPTEELGIRAWLRAWAPLPDDAHLHACVLAYNADECISDNVLVPHGVTWTDEGLEVVSLDHSMWFHRPFRADEWLFWDQAPVSTAHGRGLAFGRVWDRAGRLVASMAQEALMRV
ncbi:MAG: acyl-CoA thioesterase [Acidimicrobiales bacterium]